MFVTFVVYSCRLVLKIFWLESLITHRFVAEKLRNKIWHVHEEKKKPEKKRARLLNKNCMVILEDG